MVQWLRFRAISAASSGSVRPLVMELDPTCLDEDRRSWEPQLRPCTTKQIKQFFFFKENIAVLWRCSKHRIHVFFWQRIISRYNLAQLIKGNKNTASNVAHKVSMAFAMTRVREEMKWQVPRQTAVDM